MTYNIQTVLGLEEWDGIGIWDAHVHLIGGPHPLVSKDEDLIIDDEAEAQRQLEIFYELGGKVVTEFSAYDYGRDPDALVRLSRNTGVKILMATGFYTSPGADETLKERTYTQWVDHFIHEIEEGIGINKAKPAFIKWATSKEITNGELEVLNIIAEVHKQTGITVATHSHRGILTVKQAKLLKSKGVNPESIIIGHMDRNLDLKQYKDVLNEGVFVTFDQISHTKYGSDEKRLEIMKEICHEGYSHRIILATDLGRKTYLRDLGLKLLPQFRNTLLETGFSEGEVYKLVSKNAGEAYQVKKRTSSFI